MNYAPRHSNKPEYTFVRRKLRRHSTKAEQVLWQELRAGKLGYKFRRQFQIGKFVVDFCCFSLRLVIELDGPIHDEQKMYDAKRQTYIERLGYNVVQYKNDDVLFDRERVIEEIKHLCCPPSC